MYDLRWIRENPEAFDAALAARGLAPLASDVLARDEAARANRTALQEMQNRRNALSKGSSVYTSTLKFCIYFLRSETAKIRSSPFEGNPEALFCRSKLWFAALRNRWPY